MSEHSDDQTVLEASRFPVRALPAEPGPPGEDGLREFREWAPTAEQSMVLVLNGAEHEMAPADDGWWQTRVEAEPGDRYGYRIDGGPVFPSPTARRLPEGPHGLAAVVDTTDFVWHDDDWAGVPLAGSVLYEMHIGTFTPEGTFDAAIERLDHLVDLGVDVVEVMPVASFPGTHGWGYDGVALWSVHEPYGGPAGLHRFVDACHARGLGVGLDVVHNHLGPDGAYAHAFGPYFTDRHHTPWGAAVNLDGPDSDPVRAFLIGNALAWLDDFHLDGLRLDAVHELHDHRAVPILEELSAAVADLSERTSHRRWLVAETDRNDPRTVQPREQGGLGMDGQWADDVHHGWHAVLTGEDQGYYCDFAELPVMAALLGSPFHHADTWSTFRGRRHGRPVPTEVEGWRFVVFLENHDQVGNRATGDRHAHSLSTRRLQCGAALLLTSPYTPMLFMGEEWGASTPWQYFTDHIDLRLADAVREGRRREFAAHGWSGDEVPDPQSPSTRDGSVLDWSEIEEGDHRVLLRWYRALLALRRARADLRDPDRSQVRTHLDPGTGTLVVERGQHRIAVNLGVETVEADLHLESTRGRVVLLSTDCTTALDEDGCISVPPDGVVVVGPSTAE
ncbi:malto-oligosyltrehalose trehalohydrolase [Austwickia chelonae]|uniref:malto-oligosyltrehalose trehalohydrolase n=1 Tax=Austwickia chelonae TaxID=100225 RepID=UPI000E2452E1|nr:malto-oligosyltrehalose trehalohydrolase [Austwickia chelonae]